MRKRLKEHMLRHNINPYTLHNVATITLMTVVILINRVAAMCEVVHVVGPVGLAVQLYFIWVLIREYSWYATINAQRALNKKEIHDRDI